MVSQKILIKSAVAGAILTFLDYLFHITYANPETLYYFIYKFLLAGAVAYLFYTGGMNFLKLSKKSINYLLYYAVTFAVIHGFYYRVLELLQGNPFWSRVGDIQVFGLDLMASSFTQSMFGWLIAHGGSFIIAVLWANIIIKGK